ncbi:MAG: anhydro-N-acetylmuramic acid kinase [Caldimonas sp.]
MGSLYIGLMSGTSLDGIDGVVVDFGPREGGASFAVVAHRHRRFEPRLRAELAALNEAGNDEIHRAALAANGLARHYAELVEELVVAAAPDRAAIVAVGCHGQTVRHRPREFDGTGYSVQLNAPALLAERCGIDVVADFRSRDVAAGGHGAPLVPAFHRAVFGRAGQTVAVLNLGGIANLSVLSAGGATSGFDCGPANALLDLWNARSTGLPFDADGAWAAQGSIDVRLLDALLAEPYFSAPPPKSTGRDLFNGAWLDDHIARVDPLARLRAEDVQSTLLELTVRVCAEACRRHAPDAVELIVCGGGAFNGELMRRLMQRLAPTPVVTSSARGLPPDQVEATAFAWLARAFVERRPGNVPAVTGAAGPRILGALYPAG